MSFNNLFNQTIEIEKKSGDAIRVTKDRPKKAKSVVKVKPKTKVKKKGLSKEDRKAWWETRTPEEQADFIYEKMLEDGRNPDWQAIYADVIKKNRYLH